MDLFSHKAAVIKTKEAPLADRMRPENLDEYVGQSEVVGPASPLRGLLEADKAPSMIFWGPPGVGKTTLARLVARTTKARFVAMSAVGSGVAELRQVVAEAEERLKLHATRTIVFVDEIHRWNKSQQDAFLPYVEDGTVTLIGATTENPSFEVNGALLSRCKVFVLEKLESADIERLLERALQDDKRGYGALQIKYETDVLSSIAAMADGDARAALGALEMVVSAAKVSGADGKMIKLTKAGAAALLRRSHLTYDKTGEEHFNVISAFHKSLRGSDADAALYWMGRMLEAGEDPLYVARRMVRFAAEDVGLADPQALVVANAAFQAAYQLGMPECDVCLAEAAAYLARAPKSNALYVAYGRVKKEVMEGANDPVPLHLRNAPTKLMKSLGYGRDYVYSHDAPEAPQEFLPERLRGRRFLDRTK